MKKKSLLILLAALLCVANMWASVNADDYKLPGAFSVSSTKVVYFSQGNLQYTKSTGKWKIMDHQYDVVETLNQNVGDDYASQDVISLFGWGTSGWNNTATDATSVHYQPYSTCRNYDGTVNNNYQYGPSNANVVGSSTASSAESWSKSDSYKNYDWGVFNSSDLGSGWRTLTTQEWGYLFNTRTNAANLRTFATVNSVPGLIIMPDGWTASGVSLTVTTSNYTTNNINLTNWGTLEEQGCVFLPAAGYRYGTSVYSVGTFGYYWSSSANSATYAYDLYFYLGNVYPQVKDNRYYGYSVRLVSETAPKTPASVTAAPTAKNLTYTGSTQALVNAGTASGGTLNYSLDNTNWSEDIPTATNAGDYTVYYMVVGDASHADFTPSPNTVAVTIAKSSTTTIATVPAAIENLEYTGDAQPLATAGSSPDGTMMYSLDGTNWSEDIPTGTAVGDYTVYYYVKGDANHNDGAVQSFNVSIAEKASAAMGDSGDNTVVGAAISSFLAAQDGHTIGQVAIVRPVYRNTYYNTLCLPFDLPTLTGTILEGFKVMELSGISVSGGTLNVELEEATSIVAGKPYFVKYEAETDILSQLDFTDVTINNADLIDNAVTIDGVTFRGTFAPYAMEAQTEENHSYLFLGQNNVLYWPNANGNLLSFRAFFVINTGANNSPIRRGMPARIVENHQTTTDFENVQNNVRSEKVMENGVLYIIKNGVKYNAQGQEVR